VELADIVPDLLCATLPHVRRSVANGSASPGWSGEVATAEAATTTGLPPALLTVASYNGTLAAVRALGRVGIPVTTADRSTFAIGAWSRYASARLQSPEVRDTPRFVKWLIDFGQQHDKHVLLPTSDDTAWLFALHREELSRYFHLSAPPFTVISRLLNKASLYDEAVAAGLDVPRTWFPRDAADLDRCRREARFPVVIKPRTQVLFRTKSKGHYVENADALSDRYSSFAVQRHEAGLVKLDPAAAQPMVQEFHREAATGIYSISAYAHDGRLLGPRGARKLLQQPRRLGIGVCFEEAEILPQLAAGLTRLVERVGFAGVFEAEFIETPDGPLLIDFNPRFYNQMAFDIARGVPLPLLAYYDALGDRERLDILSQDMAMAAPSHGRVFVDLISLRLLLAAQRLSGALSREEKRRWTEWYESNRSRCTYAVLDAEDRLPAWFAGMQLAFRCARHPRNFVRSIVLNR
jgi:D-aspartate ligase